MQRCFVAALQEWEFMFPCNQWLDERSGDGQLQRRLQPKQGLTRRAKYRLRIATSDMRGAGGVIAVPLLLVGWRVMILAC